MFGIIKKIFLFIFGGLKDAGFQKGDILPNIKSNKLKLESIEELNKQNLEQDQDQIQDSNQTILKPNPTLRASNRVCERCKR